MTKLNPVRNNNPSVSISLTTFNQAKYIEQALDSVLMQETNFDYELIIGEDDSNDGTREIVLSYKEKYPNKIKLLLNKRDNVIFIDGKPTGRWNIINNLKHCKGKYIALLEGDDYWTDPHKLQKQVEFLENNPGHSMCFHKVYFDYEDIDIDPVVYEPYKGKRSYSLGDLIQKNFIATLSVLYRNYDFFSDMPDWFYSAPIGDYPLHILTAENGKVGFLDELMGVRRVHENGYWSKMSLMEKYDTSLEVSNLFYEYFKDGTYANVARSSLYYSKYRYDYIRKKFGSSIFNLIKCLYLVPNHISVHDRGLLKSLADIFIPVKMQGEFKQFAQKYK